MEGLLRSGKLTAPACSSRTHPESDYIWADQTKHPEPEVQQSVQVIDKATGEIVKTIQITEEEGNVAVHFEFNQDGSEVWVSKWNRSTSKEPNGEIVIYDAQDAGGDRPREGPVCADRQVQRLQPIEPRHLTRFQPIQERAGPSPALSSFDSPAKLTGLTHEARQDSQHGARI